MCVPNTKLMTRL